MHAGPNPVWLMTATWGRPNTPRQACPNGVVTWVNTTLHGVRYQSSTPALFVHLSVSPAPLHPASPARPYQHCQHSLCCAVLSPPSTVYTALSPAGTGCAVLCCVLPAQVALCCAQSAVPQPRRVSGGGDRMPVLPAGKGNVGQPSVSGYGIKASLW